MKLWLLTPRDDLPKPDPRYLRVRGNPWEPWYDKAFGFVVRAETAEQARGLASKHKGSEGADAWLDPTLSNCTELTTDGDAEVIIIDFHSA